MSECDVARERMPQLLIEALGGAERESSHEHIEGCTRCSAEWDQLRETWRELGEVEDVPVPAGLRARFLDAVGAGARRATVVPFHRRPAARWLAQAAAVVLLIGGSFFAGRETSSSGVTPLISNAADGGYQISGSRVIPASQLSPVIYGTPRIDNVRFMPQETGGGVQLAFDLTSEVMVTGRPGDQSLANLLAYVLESQQNTTHSRSSTIQWIRENWEGREASPEIARALASVLTNDTHEGVRLKAIDALSAFSGQATSPTQAALIGALKNDPNPMVRLKAVEALANIADSGSPLDPAMLETLTEKANQEDENLYVRLKAAEALSQIDL